jgi:exodeoxyribonuclease-3
MQIATWNVNSVRTRIEHVKEWLTARTPAVLCLQETKVQDQEFPRAAFSALGYESAIYGQKTYNGVSLHSTGTFNDVWYGFPDPSMNEQKRVIAATVGGIRIVNAYVPQGVSPESEKFRYKLEFLHHLRDYAGQLLKEHEHLVLLGDFNIAPHERDLFDPSLFQDQVMFHPLEHEALRALEALGMKDALRLVSDAPGIYSWWDYREGAFWKNRGIRLDLIWVSPALAPHVESVVMERDTRKKKQPSDHVPVVLTLKELPCMKCQ